MINLFRTALLVCVLLSIFGGQTVWAASTSFKVSATIFQQQPSDGYISTPADVVAQNTVTINTQTTTNSIAVHVTTGAPIILLVRWGRTPDYELGNSVTTSSSMDHIVSIAELLAGTRYYVQVVGYTSTGVQAFVKNLVVTTDSLQDVTPPGNVSDLVGTFTGKNIMLSWQNPTDSDFSYVRIVRNPNFYPVDEADGMVVYEGSAKQFRDTDIAFDTQYYYTVFSYDQLGNRSSGAVALVHTRTGQAVATSTLSDIPPEAISTTLPVAFMQGLLIQQINDGTVRVLNSVPLTISLPYESVPQHLKSIVVTIQQEESGKVYSFLLRANTDKTAYEATLSSLAESGYYNFTLVVYDHATQISLARTGRFLVVADERVLENNFLATTVPWRLVWYALLLLVVPIFFIYMLKRRIEHITERRRIAR